MQMFFYKKNGKQDGSIFFDADQGDDLFLYTSNPVVQMQKEKDAMLDQIKLLKEERNTLAMENEELDNVIIEKDIKIKDLNEQVTGLFETILELKNKIANMGNGTVNADISFDEAKNALIEKEKKECFLHIDEALPLIGINRDYYKMLTVRSDFEKGKHYPFSELFTKEIFDNFCNRYFEFCVENGKKNVAHYRNALTFSDVLRDKKLSFADFIHMRRSGQIRFGINYKLDKRAYINHPVFIELTDIPMGNREEVK